MTAQLAATFEEVMKGGPMDLPAFYREARETTPIFRSDAFNGWVVTRYNDAKRVLTDEECFGPLTYGAGSSIIHGRTILQMEGDEHRRKGAILARTLRNTRLLDGVQRDYTRKLADSLFEKFPTTGPVDLKAAFTTPLPLGVTSWVMDIQEAPNFRANYDAIVAAGASNLRGDPAVVERALAAKTELFNFITPLIVLFLPPRRRRRDDGPCALVAREVPVRVSRVVAAPARGPLAHSRCHCRGPALGAPGARRQSRCAPRHRDRRTVGEGR
jgi:pulcherriminic acid synthase